MKKLTLVLLVLIATSAAAELKTYRSGYGEDVSPRLYGPVLDLAGSGAEETGLQAMVNAVRGCEKCDAKVDVVIIRASGEYGLNESFMELDGVDSALTLVITDRPSAQRRDIAQLVKDAEVVWFAGGDQCQYIRFIKGTRVHRAVESVFKRGGAIGGNSAGLAIQGDIAYDACPDVSAKSSEVLLNPFLRDVSLSTGFLHWPILKDTITDTHFRQRDRLGRTLVFLARTYAERRRRVDAIAVDEGTSVVVTADGKGRVYGKGAAYLIVADHPAEVLERDKPLTYRGLQIRRLVRGEEIDLKNRPTTGFKTIEVVEGKVSADPY
jgi:cyanophycinase